MNEVTKAAIESIADCAVEKSGLNNLPSFDKYYDKFKDIVFDGWGVISESVFGYEIREPEDSIERQLFEEQINEFFTDFFDRSIKNITN